MKKIISFPNVLDLEFSTPTNDRSFSPEAPKSSLLSFLDSRNKYAQMLSHLSPGYNPYADPNFYVQTSSIYTQRNFPSISSPGNIFGFGVDY